MIWRAWIQFQLTWSLKALLYSVDLQELPAIWNNLLNVLKHIYITVCVIYCIKYELNAEFHESMTATNY